MTRPLTPIEEAERAGFDMSLVEESLSYSYEQRALHHQAALNLALEMENAGRRIRDRHQSTSSSSAASPRLCTVPHWSPEIWISARF
jgi:hypothetical protein